MKQIRLMLLGGPGAGKGTQAKKLMDYFNIPQISTGDMLRAAIANGSDLGLKAKKIMDEGQLVSDDIMIRLVQERLQHEDCQRGFLLDGFPRTIVQAEALKQAGIKIDHVLEISVDDEEIVKRISGRRIHPSSGRVYHLVYNPPASEGEDDVTKEPLIQRDDDREEIIRKRLKIYHEQTEPLISYYRQWARSRDEQAPEFHHIIGTAEVEDIFQRIIKAIGEKPCHHKAP